MQLKRLVVVPLGALLATVAFVGVSYPASLIQSNMDRQMCPVALHSYPGSTTVDQCIKSRQERRWGPWKAWGSNAPEED
jgi:hypothetical protein